MSGSLEARLQYLEAREEANTKDIIRLKTENAELQTKLFDLKQENSQAVKKPMEMNECFKKLEESFEKMKNDLTIVFGFRDVIENRLAHLESVINGLKENHDRVSNLETDFNQIKLEMTNQCQSLTQKLETFQREYRQSDSQLEGACAMPVSPAASLDVKLSTLDNVPPRQEGSIADRLNILERQTQETLNTVQRLDTIRGYFEQSVAQFGVKPRKGLKTGKFVKLDKCTSVSINGGCFNEDDCCFDPPVRGRYLVHMYLNTNNNGEIEGYAMTSGSSKSTLLLSTCEYDEPKESLDLFTLEQGERIWFQVKRLDGNAYIHSCAITIWLVSPS